MRDNDNVVVYSIKKQQRIARSAFSSSSFSRRSRHEIGVFSVGGFGVVSLHQFLFQYRIENALYVRDALRLLRQFFKVVQESGEIALSSGIPVHLHATYL